MQFLFKKYRRSTEETDVYKIEIEKTMRQTSTLKLCSECLKELKDKIAGQFVKSKIVRDCLSCSNSFSESCEDGDILHCMEQDGKVVEENGCCNKWN